MNVCDKCGKEYEGEYCPLCSDVVSLDLPEYDDSEQHIIGDTDDDYRSFQAQKLEIYRRNELIADERKFVEQAEDEKRRRELDRKLEQNALKRSTEVGVPSEHRWKSYARIASAFAAAIVVIIGIAVFINNVIESNRYIPAPVNNEYVVSTAAQTTAKPAKTAKENNEAKPAKEEVTQEQVIIPPEYMPLEAEDGQLSYSDGVISGVMDFDYMLPLNGQYDVMVFCLDFTVKNISDDSFYFVAQKFCLYNGDMSEIVQPISYSESNYYADAAKVFTLGCGEEVSYTLYYNVPIELCDAVVGVGYFPDTVNPNYNLEADNPFSISYNEIIAFTARDGNGFLPESYYSQIERYKSELAMQQATVAAEQSYSANAFSQGDGQYVFTNEYFSFCFSVGLCEDKNYASVNMRVRKMTDSSALTPMYPDSFKLKAALFSGVGRAALKPKYCVLDENASAGAEAADIKIDGITDTLFIPPDEIGFDENGEMEIGLIYDVSATLNYNSKSIDEISYDISSNIAHTPFSVKISL